MPVTAKLSKRFYDAFGEDLANELVELISMVGAASHDELTRLADEYHTRLRLELERFATKADLERFATNADLERFPTKADLERFATKADLERFATKADLERFATKADLERFATKADLQHFATKADLAALRNELRADMSAMKADLMKWMLVFWVGTSVTTISMVLTVVSVIR
jgi:hypothetical protein